jgi:GNAT superfamily N-acetyltransferase
MIRERRAEDLRRCVALLREVHAADRYPVIWPADPARWLTGRYPLCAWVAEEPEDRLIGHLSLHGTDAVRARRQWREAAPVPLERIAVVSRFFVAPAARRRGVGGALLQRAEEHATARGQRLVLDVADHNRAAIALYEGRGWRRVGTAELSLSAAPWRLNLVLFVRD